MTMNIGYMEKGNGHPIVFLHGMAAYARTFQNQIDFFGQAYRTVALDLPGYGDTPALPQTTFQKLADWLQSVLAELDIEAPILVGHSFGGMVVQEYLAHYDTPVHAAILYGTSPAFGKPDGDWQQKFVRARLQPLDDGKTMPELALQIARGLVGTNATIEGIARAQAGISATSSETFRTAVHTIVTFDQRANLPHITCPTLCIVGAEDNNAPPAMMEKMASRISDGTYICLPGLGHMAHLEDPDAFNNALARFLTCASPS